MSAALFDGVIVLDDPVVTFDASALDTTTGT